MTSSKWIPGYEGIYKVSRDCKVYSIARNGTGGGFIKDFPHYKGYRQFYLMKNNVRKIVTAHQLMARTFLPNPLNLKEVNHKNGIKTDNRVENLEWCTRKENMKHAYNNGYLYIAKGEKHHNAKLNTEKIVEIRRLAKTGLSYVALGKIFNTDDTNISLIVRLKSWKHVKEV